MTITSEITRIQGAKADIKASIEAKGVSIPSSDTIDCYACCIDSISSGVDYGKVDYLLVGGGGGSCKYTGAGGGGGGGFVESFCQDLLTYFNVVVVGAGGGCWENGGDSIFNGEIAYGGGANGSHSGDANQRKGKNGGSGGGGHSYFCCSGAVGGCACSGQGYNGGTAGKGGNYVSGGGGGGGGAGGAGGNGNGYIGGTGGVGKASSMSGTSVCYSGGGGGYGCNTCAGNGGLNNGINQCGGGGGGRCSDGTSYAPETGNPGVVIIRYKTDGSCGINCATGGCKYTCGDYTIHCFTNTGVFCVEC